jgi:hypothetical protein
MEYQEPQAHHWIALRLIRGYVGVANRHNRDCVYTIHWLIKELGLPTVQNMTDQLKLDESQTYGDTLNRTENLTNVSEGESK